LLPPREFKFCGTVALVSAIEVIWLAKGEVTPRDVTGGVNKDPIFGRRGFKFSGAEKVAEAGAVEAGSTPDEGP
jgi:hypothetical protein